MCTTWNSILTHDVRASFACTTTSICNTCTTGEEYVYQWYKKKANRLWMIRKWFLPINNFIRPSKCAELSANIIYHYQPWILLLTTMESLRIFSSRFSLLEWGEFRKSSQLPVEQFSIKTSGTTWSLCAVIFQCCRPWTAHTTHTCTHTHTDQKAG